MTKKVLRIISLIMFIAAAVFVCCAISNPTLGSTIYIGSFAFGAEAWRICYIVYCLVMVALFTISFFVGNKKK